MSDYLLDLSRSPLAKKLVRQLKLPIPLPEPLKRGEGPWSGAELAGLNIAVGGGRGSKLTATLQSVITDAAGTAVQDYAPDVALNGLLFDATPLQTTADLGALYDFVKPRLKNLASGSHVLLLGSGKAASPEAAAVAAALVGFSKSLSKEIGRKGSTSQVLMVDGADARQLAPSVRFFLSGRSAFISGQVLRINGGDPAAPAAQPLAGKVAVVTGAAQGIGAAICRRFAAEGARLVGVDRPQEKAALEALMQELGGTALPLDLLDPNAPRLVAQKVEADFGHVDVLVNNAGVTRDKTLARMPRDWWDDVLQLNLQVPIHLTEAFVNGDELIKLLNHGGRVVMLSSVAGLAGNVGQTNYAAAKAGLAGYVRALAPRLTARGITVNALAPGFIETRMTKSMPLGIREVARRFNALSQAGLPEDVAEAALFLASPGAGGISGEVLRVCGHNLIGA